MNLYLIGYRGTGKTTLAPMLAERLGPNWTWVDLDDRIEESAGRSIAEIFAGEGEVGFRDREEQALAEVAARDCIVVATGGGVIERPANREKLRQGFVVWLAATPETIERRLSEDATTRSRRPSLTGLPSGQEIRSVLARREPIYRESADCRLATDQTVVAELIERIVAEFAGRSASETRIG